MTNHIFEWNTRKCFRFSYLLPSFNSAPALWMTGTKSSHWLSNPTRVIEGNIVEKNDLNEFHFELNIEPNVMVGIVFRFQKIRAAKNRRGFGIKHRNCRNCPIRIHYTREWGNYSENSICENSIHSFISPKSIAIGQVFIITANTSEPIVIGNISNRRY